MTECYFIVMFQVKGLINVTKKDLRHEELTIIRNYTHNYNCFYHEEFIITPSFVILKTLNI